MKNAKRYLKQLLILLCVLSLAVFAGCGQEQADPTDDTQAKGDGLPMVSALQLDGGYTISFSPEVRSYEVKIPDGRPRIPKVSAEADGAYTVAVTQAVLADGQSSGSANVTVTDGQGNTGEYIITFTRDASLGFHLQYDDYYTPPTDGVQIAAYEISDPSVIGVTDQGALHAQALSDTPVTVKALAADGSELASLVIDKVVKAPLNIFLITGQSNAAGTYDAPANVDYAAFYNIQIPLALAPVPGTVLCTDVSNTGVIEKDMYDLSVGRAGFSPALGKTWYELTGEKTLMIQTAVGGSPIEAWVKPDGTNRYTYGNTDANFYETTYNAYHHCLELINAADSGYELNRVHAYWLQGETGMASTYNPNKLGPGIGDWDFGSQAHILNSQEYYDLFMQNMEYFEEDFGCEFMGILLVRAVVEVCSSESLEQQLLTDLVPARAAQYALHNSTGSNIALVSRVSDIARMESWSDMADQGWGMMGCNNLHYNQTGHNANGVEAATNTYQLIYGGDGRKATDIEIIKENGRDRLEEGEELLVVAGETYQTAAMVLPMYSDTPLISYEVADPAVCTIDAYGLITADPNAKGKETTITYTCEAAGLSRTVKIKVGAREAKQTVYEWNFDNGDLTEASGSNNLTVSEKTGTNAAYTITDGVYTSTNSLTNFKLDKPILLTTANDWSIEWRGMVTTNSALFGTAGNWTNFMYIAYSVPFEVENPLRIVGASGDALMIPYGQYASYNTSGMNTWKVEYTASSRMLTLFMNKTIPVGAVSVPDGWYAEFTNLFGSYYAGTDVDYMGSVDYVKVTTYEEVIVS